MREAEAHFNLWNSPDFNVFRILRLGRYEARAHTPLLAELLNPRGVHAQGTLFLEEFFEVARGEGLTVPSSCVAAAKWKVRSEQFCGSYGVIDIILRSNLVGYLMVIENKIGALEGPSQLKRYHDWMLTQQQSFPNQRLVFLTPSGRDATTHYGVAYTRLSYRDHISGWLRCALENVKAPPVRELVRQYLEIVRAL